MDMKHILIVNTLALWSTFGCRATPSRSDLAEPQIAPGPNQSVTNDPSGQPSGQPSATSTPTATPTPGATLVPKIHTGGYTTPYRPNPVWDIPDTTYQPLTGHTLPQLTLMTISQNPAIAQSLQAVAQAENEYFRVHDLVMAEHQGHTSESALTIGEVEKINEQAHLYDASRFTAQLTAVEKARILHEEYFKILNARHTIHLTNLKHSYLESILLRMTTLVALGEQPRSVADRIQVQMATNADVGQSAGAVRDSARASLLNICGTLQSDLFNIADFALPNISALPNPNLASELLKALNRSPAMQAALHQRDAAASRQARLIWQNSQIQISSTPTAAEIQEQMDRLFAIEAERLTVERLNMRLAEIEAKISEQLTAIEKNMTAAINQHRVYSASLPSSERAYEEGLWLLANGEIDAFAVLDRAADVFENRMKLSKSAINYLALQGELDELIVDGTFGIILNLTDGL